VETLIMTERSIFLEALDRAEPAERAAYLDQACASDAELRRRVDSLLEAHHEPGDFLEPAAIDDATVQMSDEAPDERRGPGRIPEGPGSRIGPYRLLQQIGKGGMGVVFMAEQEKPIRRKVALKIIKPGMNTGQVVARFEAERQALALMDHPNIARVLDAGTTEPNSRSVNRNSKEEGATPGDSDFGFRASEFSRGLPYFVMDLVKGVPITQFCDEAKLSPRERIDLFVPVCQAIQHAHQKGIIHRDVKPSNVMVTLHDGKPVPKIIDFGVAKATDQRLTERTLFTEYGAIIGTPEYMSPEQAEHSSLDVDTRTDIFSLGVLLYELLTGSTPLERTKLREAGYAEVLRRIKEEEAPKPSTRLSHSGDRLASIAATRRTEPARLTRLVRGELDWIVMKALEKDRSRRYATANGLARDIQRYLDGEPVEAGPPSASYKFRKFARKHSATLATLAAFVILLMAASMVSAYLAIRATRAEHAARDQAAIAVAVSDFLQKDLLGQVDVDSQTRAGLQSDPDVKVRKLLDRAATNISGKFVGQPLVEAAIRRTIGDAYVSLGLFDLAEPQLERSRALLSRDLGDQHPETLNAVTSLAGLYFRQGKLAKAKPLYIEALEGLRIVAGAEDADTVRATYGLAGVLAHEGNSSENELFLVRALELCRRVPGEKQYNTTVMLHHLGVLYLLAGKFAQSEALLTEALEITRNVRGDDNDGAYVLMDELACAHAAQGAHRQAEELSAKSLEGARRLRGAEHPETFVSMTLRAKLLAMIGKSADAQALSTEALEGLRRTLGDGHAFTFATRANLALCYHQQGRSEEAARCLASVLQDELRLLGDANSMVIATMNSLAEVLLDQGQPQKAEPVLVQAQKAGTGLRDARGPVIADTVTALSRVRLIQLRHAEALALAHQALGIRLDRHPDHWMRYDALSLVGAALAGQKKYAEAEPLLLEGYQGLKDREERISSLRRKQRPAEAGARIVALYDAWGKKDEAEQWRKRLKEKKAESPKPPERKP
jgi:eukaryotic-like serine/threonine-protein kinase